MTSPNKCSHRFLIILAIHLENLCVASPDLRTLSWQVWSNRKEELKIGLGWACWSAWSPDPGGWTAFEYGAGSWLMLRGFCVQQALWCLVLYQERCLEISKLGLCWWLRWWRVCLPWGRPRFHPGVGKIPWKREQLPTPSVLPGRFRRLKSLASYSPWVAEADMTELLSHTD